MQTGIELIAAERERQITSEGWSPDHDDTHAGGELADAAACYAAVAASQARGPWIPENSELITEGHMAGLDWPFETGAFKPEDQRKNLIRAGALIAAELDRLNRDEI